MNSITFIKSATTALIIVFNGVIVFRIVKTIFEGMLDEELPTGKRITNSIKAMIVVNCIIGLIAIIKKFYI